MFIRIVRGTSESLYECSQYTKRPYSEPAASAGETFTHVHLILDDHAAKGGLEIIYDATDTDLYVMNDRGETVETYRYNRNNDPSVPRIG